MAASRAAATDQPSGPDRRHSQAFREAYDLRQARMKNNRRSVNGDAVVGGASGPGQRPFLRTDDGLDCDNETSGIWRDRLRYSSLGSGARGTPAVSDRALAR